jgi:hypothetical protein
MNNTILSSFLVILLSTAVTFGYTPPYNDATAEHDDFVFYELGVYMHANSVSSIGLPSGVLHHNAWVDTMYASEMSYVVIDSISSNFTVPTSGTYSITYKGSISGAFYNVSASMVLGHAKGSGHLWLETHSPGMSMKSLYETDLSIGALIEEGAWATIMAFLQVGDFVGALDTIKSQHVPEVSWDPNTFSMTSYAYLEAGQTYTWEFSVNSNTRSISIGAAYNVATFDVDVNLEEVDIVLITPQGNDPVLSNPRVNPMGGTESTTFEFLVDYYDLDGDPPDTIYRKVYISGNGGQAEGIMSLKNGSDANGTYHYTRTLPIGSYSYMFVFSDTSGAFDMTSWQDGPYVHSDDDAVINIVIQCTRISSDLQLAYSLTGFSGPWTDIPITKQILDPLLVPSGSTVYFKAVVDGPNYQYREWELWESGTRIAGNTSSMFSFTLGATTTEVGLNVFYDYTPQYYTISGTVLRDDSNPVPGGVDLTLTSPEQTMLQHSTDGNFSFTGVQGGTSVTITPSADGYNFSPPSLIYHNLKDNYPGQTIVAYTSDTYVPMTSFLTVPPAVSENSSVSFSWIGEDDVTPLENLLYQYKLDNVDLDWSAWVSDTSKSYDLENGTYTFWVRAKDEADNINQAPLSYKFVVNAAPRVVSSLRTKRSVWASRVTLSMPNSPSHPKDVFVLLPDHSGTSDSELVPVAIHRVDDPNPSGVSDIVADKLGLTPRITKANVGWLVTLPQPIPLGQTMEYDIVWGKIQYFGWKELVLVPWGFPNAPRSGGAASYLDENRSLWRVSTKYDNHGGSPPYDDESWVFMDVSSQYATIVDETLVQYARGEFWGGATGTNTIFYVPHILKTGSNICIIWQNERYEYDGSTTYYYERYGLQLFDNTGRTLFSTDGDYYNRANYLLPRELIHNRIWITADQRSSVDNKWYAWFIVLDESGNEVAPKTIFDSIVLDSGVSNLRDTVVYSIGENVLILWQRTWPTSTSYKYRRTEIRYQIRDSSGSIVVKDTATLPFTLAPDSQPIHDEFLRDGNLLTDAKGKVWIPVRHSPSSQKYYVVVGTDGNIWRGPVQTTTKRVFHFCDKDGYIWATEGGQFFVLNDDDTIAVAPRTVAWIPNQDVGSIAALVDSDDYRLYDRWSPQFIGIDVPSGICPNSMELFDLNLWDNELHTADVNLMKGNTPVWSQDGQFTGHMTVDVSGIINEGVNIFTMTQNDFLGGQVLTTFPYTIPVIGDITCDGKVNFKDMLVLANQWLQPPGIPSADLAPSPLDNFVNFLDFAVLANDWLSSITP